jgi:hypothetical protein
LPRNIHQLTRGYFNLVQHKGQALRAIGWMLTVTIEAFFRPDDSQSANGLESSTWSSFGTPASGISRTSWY